MRLPTVSFLLAWCDVPASADSWELPVPDAPVGEEAAKLKQEHEQLEILDQRLNKQER